MSEQHPETTFAWQAILQTEFPHIAYGNSDLAENWPQFRAKNMTGTPPTTKISVFSPRRHPKSAFGGRRTLRLDSTI